MREHEPPDDRRAAPRPPAPASNAGDPREAGLDAALAALPRELPPPAELEHRVVDDLRRHGLLGPPERGRRVRRSGALPRWAGAAMAAAAVALVMSGFAAGHHMGSAQTAAALLQSQKQNAETAVRQAGAAYVAALAALAERRGVGEGPAAAAVEAQARIAFLAAADQMVRLFPDDPLAAGILRASERGREFGGVVQPGDSTLARRVVWF